MRAAHARHVAVSDTISNRRQLLNFRVHAGTLARSTRPEPGPGLNQVPEFRPSSRFREKLANLVQRTNQVRTDLFAHSLRVYSRTLAHASARVSDTKIVRGDQVRYGAVSDTSSTSRQHRASGCNAERSRRRVLVCDGLCGVVRVDGE
jgi:hypothetical protein